GGGAGDLDAAIGSQHRPGARLHLHRLPDAGGHSPADKLVAVTHRARLRIALRPGKLLCALAIAFAQLLAAVGQAPELVAAGIIDQPQLERIELRRVGELVHRAFDSIDALGAAWPAHVARRVLVELDQLLAQLAVGAAIELARPADKTPLEILELRGHGDDVVPKRREAA